MKAEQKDKNVVLRGIVDFDVEQTLECGQCFHFVKVGEREYGVSACNRLLHIKQTEDEVIFYDTTMDEYENIWSKYFDLDRDYGAIKKKLLDNDDKLQEAVYTMDGVRILEQEFFETLISFIISQNKQIPHIKKIVADISEKYGTYVGNIGEEKFYAFPTIEQLRKVTVDELRECKTGFRAPYIADAVVKVMEGTVNEEKLKLADEQSCEEQLTQIKGVGNKVANCVMLFGLGKREAFPVDVWIKRIMEYLYFEGVDTSKEKIYAFAREHFGEYGGYAQQYLFYYGKTVKMGVNKVKTNKEEKGKQDVNKVKTNKGEKVKQDKRI